MRSIIAAVAGALIAALVAPHLFTSFAAVREKVVRADLPASAEQLRVPIGPNAPLEQLRTPFALITRVRHGEAGPLVFRIAVDDREVCAAEVPAGKSQRIDCAVRQSWTGDNHNITFATTSARFTVEYLELATHYGALTTGPRNLIIGPEGFTASHMASGWHVVIIFVLITLSVWCVRDPRLPTVVSVVHLVLTVLVGTVMAIVILAAWVSPYSILIGTEFLERLLLLTALPALVAAGYGQVKRWERPGLRPVLKVVAAGLVVGGFYLTYATSRAQNYDGNVSGLLLISHRFFDKNPFVNNRDDIKQALHFSDGGGYDGQFFYYMAFDPFLTTFRHEPKRYNDYIDNPPYRYGRIGFSLLTKIFSGDRPLYYPATQVSLVLVALSACAVLLGSIARRHGRSPWYGLLILLVPGFLESTQGALSEPVAIAFCLGAYLCLVRQNWWACGLLLGLSMLIRETGGGLVLALTVGVALTGRWRESAIVALLAFLPVVLWKAFVGWVFFPEYGVAGLMPAPNDVGAPFAGVVHLWGTIARGEYFEGSRDMARAGLTYPFLATAAAALAAVATIKRPSPVAVAALFYGILTITFNYEGVWLHVGNAHRLTIDLFVALALVSVQPWRDQRVWPVLIALFWGATAIYLLFASYEAFGIRAAINRMVTGW